MNELGTEGTWDGKPHTVGLWVVLGVLALLGYMLWQL